MLSIMYFGNVVIAVTPWSHLTFDLQTIEPSIRNRDSASSENIHLFRDVSESVVMP